VKLRFQADADLRQAIVAGVLRKASGIEFRSAITVPLEGLPDPIVLAMAAEAGRVVVSHDINTMPMHFREFTRAQNSPGLILIPQRLATARAIDDIVLLWDILDTEDLVNRTCLIPSLAIY
jgi:hypothetical protein